MKRWKRVRGPQCPSMFTSGKGRIKVTVFCVKSVDHEGDHRGSGRQWNNKGQRVKITERLPE
jgi:hypothetical protein